MHILIVDDQAANRVMLKGLIERFGHSVSCAENGMQALELFSHKGADIVLLDVMMPVMDGVALTHALQRIDPQVHIVGSTGFAGDGARGDRMEELRQLGVKTVLQKPYTRRQLLNTLAAELKEELGAGI